MSDNMKIVGDYEYDEKNAIGEGTFGTVYKGHRKTNIKKVVAIKKVNTESHKLKSSPEMITREIDILKSLSDLPHRNIVTLLHWEQQGNYVYFIMELCTGGNLAEYLQSKQKLDERTLRLFLRQIAAGLKAAHDMRIVHRDLKPENIMLCFSGPKYPGPHYINLKIADFGIARFLDDEEMARTLCGTPRYMAPEVHVGRRYGHMVDLWSIGVIAYECLVGSLPTGAYMAFQDVEIPKNISAAFTNLLNGLLEKDENKRFDTNAFLNHTFLDASPDEIDLRDGLEAYKDFIKERLDPDFGLLDELLLSRSLTRQEVARVKAVPHSYGRSDKVLEYVFVKDIYKKLLDALRATQQTHLANFIMTSGERRPVFGDDWPLTEQDISILNTNERSLVDLPDISDLLNNLFYYHVINRRQRNFVSSKPTTRERSHALMEILRRTSLQNNNRTIYCLYLSEQSHLADALKDGEGVGSELKKSFDKDDDDAFASSYIAVSGEAKIENTGRKVEKQLEEITECPICLNPVTLQCNHTSCSECQNLFGKATNQEPGDKMPCPLCRREFIIPTEGVTGQQSVLSTGDFAKRTEKNFRQATVCSVCMNRFTDPRVLPCIHTFCLKCISLTTEKSRKKSGDKVPCPLCRTKFTIPEEGIVGLQNDYVMQIKDPRFKFGNETKENMKQIANGKFCIEHIHESLDSYCLHCKKIICDICRQETHKLHICKDVPTIDNEFRQTIKRKSQKMSAFVGEMLFILKEKEKRKAAFLRKIVAKEKEIYLRNQELKNMIDRHTKSLLDELSEIKSKHLKEMENQMDETERCCIILSSFEAYCNELTLKGSASDICSSVDQLFHRAEVLEKDHEAFIGRPHQSVEVNFIAADLRQSEVLKEFYSFVGNIKETTKEFENCAIVVGDSGSIDVIKINLHRPNEITTLEQIPTTIGRGGFAAVYCNTMYVTGIGDKEDEIWKYADNSGWKKCTSLAKGRSRHSAAFIDEVLYICGGFDDSKKRVLDSVEAYNAVDDKCTTVGKLVHCVYGSDNCVSFRSSLYIFGGADTDHKELNCVQVYNTKQNTCTLLTKSMPRGYMLMRAVLWDTSVILIRWGTCFIYNIETETWQERLQFGADFHFGLVLENERIFVIGGLFRGDVRYVPLQNIIDDKPIEWKIQWKLPQRFRVYTYAKMSCFI